MAFGSWIKKIAGKIGDWGRKIAPKIGNAISKVGEVASNIVAPVADKLRDVLPGKAGEIAGNVADWARKGGDYATRIGGGINDATSRWQEKGSNFNVPLLK